MNLQEQRNDDNNFFIYFYKERAAKKNISYSTECNCNDYNLSVKNILELLYFLEFELDLQKTLSFCQIFWENRNP